MSSDVPQYLVVAHGNYDTTVLLKTNDVVQANRLARQKAIEFPGVETIVYSAKHTHRVPTAGELEVKELFK